MKVRIILEGVLTTLLVPVLLWPQTGATKALSAKDLVLQGKTSEAVRLAMKTPTGVAETLKSLLETADTQVTERLLAQAQSTLDAADRFVAECTKVRKTPQVSAEGLKGRKLRLQGILLSDQKEYTKAEAALKEALEISQKTHDLFLEAGARNNLGYALMMMGKGEDAVKEFIAARDIAESQKDPLRAGSY